MSTGNSLADRIDAEIDAAFQRVDRLKSQNVEEFQERQQRLENLDQMLEGLSEVWKPRLDALAKKFGDRVNVQPHIQPGRRSATFKFKSELASIDLRFSVSPDPDVNNVVFTSDLDILPILMKFNSHDEISFPLASINKSELGNWLDDRIVEFVRTYLSLHENQFYLKGHMVEDPIAKVQFPKYAAGATLEAGGKTLYFIDESTLREYQQNHTSKK